MEPHYVKLERLGFGAYGDVYKAVNLHTGENVALKVFRTQRNVSLNQDGGQGNGNQLPQDPGLGGASPTGIVMATLREISFLRQLRHVNVVRLVDVHIRVSEPLTEKDSSTDRNRNLAPNVKDTKDSKQNNTSTVTAINTNREALDGKSIQHFKNLIKTSSQALASIGDSMKLHGDAILKARHQMSKLSNVFIKTETQAKFHLHFLSKALPNQSMNTPHLPLSQPQPDSMGSETTSTSLLPTHLLHMHMDGPQHSHQNQTQSSLPPLHQQQRTLEIKKHHETYLHLQNQLTAVSNSIQQLNRIIQHSNRTLFRLEVDGENIKKTYISALSQYHALTQHHQLDNTPASTPAAGGSNFFPIPERKLDRMKDTPISMDYGSAHGFIPTSTFMDPKLGSKIMQNSTKPSTTAPLYSSTDLKGGSKMKDKEKDKDKDKDKEKDKNDTEKEKEKEKEKDKNDKGFLPFNQANFPSSAFSLEMALEYIPLDLKKFLISRSRREKNVTTSQSNPLWIQHQHYEKKRLIKLETQRQAKSLDQGSSSLEMDTSQFHDMKMGMKSKSDLLTMSKSPRPKPPTGPVPPKTPKRATQTDLQNGLEYDMVCSLMFQLLQGVAYIHSQNIIHRDIKPENILLTNTGVVKIADFGLARVRSSVPGTYNHQVVTLPYRAPEILLEYPQYDTGIDIWSVGCVFAEIMTGEMLFPARNATEMLDYVFGVFGLPSAESIPVVLTLNADILVQPPKSEAALQLESLQNNERKSIAQLQAVRQINSDSFDESKFPPTKPDFNLNPSIPAHRKKYKRYDESGKSYEIPFALFSLKERLYLHLLSRCPTFSIEKWSIPFDLLTQMLRVDPEERISAQEALAHPFFHDIPLVMLPMDVQKNLK